MSSRWAEDEAEIAARKREKEEKRRLKAEKQRQHEIEAAKRKVEQDVIAAQQKQSQAQEQEIDGDAADGRPSKRRRVSDPDRDEPTRRLLRFPQRTWSKARSFQDNFESLNSIGKGAYGEVFRARDRETKQVVAVKELESYNPNDGVPITTLREIRTLKAARHPNVVQLLEVVTSQNKEDAPIKVALVMEFIEHDLMTLHAEMDEPFLQSEIKTLFIQTTSALEFLHSHWILHRDLKTSNILLTNTGQIKLADFGSARFFGDPPPSNLTQLVVTLWYRAPELLLGASKYDTAVDVWSLGCIFGELLQKGPLMQGKNELDQITKIFELCGLPTDRSWPGFRRLPNARSLNIPRTESSKVNNPNIRPKFPLLTNEGCSLLTDLLSLDPLSRPSAAEVLLHPYFSESPQPKHPSLFPTFPSRAQGERRKKMWSPGAPKGGGAAPKLNGNIFANRDTEEAGAGFRLRVG